MIALVNERCTACTVENGSDQDGIPADRGRLAVELSCLGIAGGDLADLAPIAWATEILLVDVHGPGVGSVAVIVQGRPHNGDRAVDTTVDTEMISGRCVAGHELLELDVRGQFR